MQEKKKFILAVPTVIIIIIFIISIFFIFYKKNIKDMTKDEALVLAEKVLRIDNLSCEIIAKQGDTENATDYKRLGKLVYMKSDELEQYLDTEKEECIYVDTAEKEAYKYSSNAVIDSYNEMIYTGVSFLKDESLNYKFNKYEKVNGIDCASITLNNSTTNINMWLDKSSGMITKFSIKYLEEEGDETTYVYRYQIGKVKENEVKAPDLSSLEGYDILDMNE